MISVCRNLASYFLQRHVPSHPVEPSAPQLGAAEQPDEVLTVYGCREVGATPSPEG